MPMVRIGHVGMGVLYWSVMVPMAVRARGHHVMGVRVVTVVMGVCMLVLQGLMHMRMFVPLR